MSIFGNYTIKSLKANKTRTVVSVIGVMLSVGLLTAVFATVSSMNKALFNEALDREGGWYFAYPQASDAAIDALISSENIDCLQTIHELGSTNLDSQTNPDYNSLIVRSVPEILKGKSPFENKEYLTNMPKIIDGRLPKNMNEIILPDFMIGDTISNSYIRTNGKLKIGSLFQIKLGVRVADNDKFDAGSVLTGNSGPRLDEATNEYLHGGWHYDSLAEHVYKVVGFYEVSNTGNGFADNICNTNSDGEWNSAVGITKDYESAFDVAIVHATASGIKDFNELDNLAQSCAKTKDYTDYQSLPYPRLVTNNYTTHDGLVRYLGIVDGSRAIFDSLFRFALVLGVVISIASISLIYNSFAISVAERTRQFGLLSSLGASNRQLRTTVLNEALILGVIGIPLGILSGLIGVKVVLKHLKDTFTMMIGREVLLSVNSNILIGVVLASLIILLISAWIPALRASKVSAVDAIRQTQDVKITRRAKREVTKVKKRLNAGEDLVDASRYKGLTAKLFGVPGFVAHRNLSRSSSKGRVIAASLGISVMLFVVAGSIYIYLSPFANTGAMEGAGQGNADVYFGAFENREMFDNEDIKAALEQVKQTPGASTEFTATCGRAFCEVPNSLENQSVIDQYKESFNKNLKDDTTGDLNYFNEANDYFGPCSVAWIPDDYWKELCEQAGVVPEFDKPQAIFDNRLKCQDEEGKYSVIKKPISSSGTINLIGLMKDGRIINKSGEYYNPSVVNGKETVRVYDDGNYVNADVELVKEPLEVTGFIDEDIDSWGHRLSSIDTFPCLLINYAAAEKYQDILAPERSAAGFIADDSKILTEKLMSLGGKSVYIEDVTGNEMQAIMMLEMMRLFIALFSGIMMLIATANVFNTLTNSVILRTKEFAVLKSVGMDAKAFRKMLICECSSYALKGLILGVGLSVIASYGMYCAMELSFAGLEFTMPWMHLVIAVLGVFAVLALSVRYALVKSKSSNIVEALRIDAI